MIIAYDVSHVQVQRAGIGQASLALLEEVIDRDRHNTYLLHGWSYSLDVGALRPFARANVSLRLARIPGPLKRFYWDRMPLPALERLIGRCDIFHSSDPSFPPLSSARVVLTVHDTISLTHPEFHMRSVVDRDRRLLNRIGGAAAIVVPSEATRDAVRRLGVCREERIHVYPPAVSPLFSPDEGAGETALLTSCGITRPYLLFVGTLEPRKNLQGIIRAFDLISERRGGDIDLVLVGKIGWKSEALLAAISRAHSTSSIRRLDYVPDRMLAALYRHALCLVYPSFAEGYGLPVAEALASGLPAVTSHDSPMAEFGQGAVLAVNPRSVDEIAEAVLRMTSSADENARWRLRARERGQVLRAERNGEGMLAIYAGLGAA